MLKVCIKAMNLWGVWQCAKQLFLIRCEDPFLEKQFPSVDMKSMIFDFTNFDCTKSRQRKPFALNGNVQMQSLLLHLHNRKNFYEIRFSFKRILYVCLDWRRFYLYKLYFFVQSAFPFMQLARANTKKRESSGEKKTLGEDGKGTGCISTKTLFSPFVDVVSLGLQRKIHIFISICAVSETEIWRQALNTPIRRTLYLTVCFFLFLSLFFLLRAFFNSIAVFFWARLLSFVLLVCIFFAFLASFISFFRFLRHAARSQPK